MILSPIFFRWDHLSSQSFSLSKFDQITAKQKTTKDLFILSKSPFLEIIFQDILSCYSMKDKLSCHTQIYLTHPPMLCRFCTVTPCICTQLNYKIISYMPWNYDTHCDDMSSHFQGQLKIFSFYMGFPWLENCWLMFQIFQDIWEPWQPHHYINFPAALNITPVSLAYIPCYCKHIALPTWILLLKRHCAQVQPPTTVVLVWLQTPGLVVMHKAEGELFSRYASWSRRSCAYA